MSFRILPAWCQPSRCVCPACCGHPAIHLGPPRCPTLVWVTYRALSSFRLCNRWNHHVQVTRRMSSSPTVGLVFAPGSDQHGQSTRCPRTVIPIFWKMASKHTGRSSTTTTRHVQSRPETLYFPNIGNEVLRPHRLPSNERQRQCPTGHQTQTDPIRFRALFECAFPARDSAALICSFADNRCVDDPGCVDFMKANPLEKSLIVPDAFM